MCFGAAAVNINSTKAGVPESIHHILCSLPKLLRGGECKIKKQNIVVFSAVGPDNNNTGLYVQGNFHLAGASGPWFPLNLYNSPV